MGVSGNPLWGSAARASGANFVICRLTLILCCCRCTSSHPMARQSGDGCDQDGVRGPRCGARCRGCTGGICARPCVASTISARGLLACAMVSRALAVGGGISWSRQRREGAVCRGCVGVSVSGSGGCPQVAPVWGRRVHQGADGPADSRRAGGLAHAAGQQELLCAGGSGVPVSVVAHGSRGMRHVLPD